MRRMLPCLTALFAFAGQAAYAAEVAIVATPAPVRQVIETPAGAFVRAGRKSYRLTLCDRAPICLAEAAVTGEPAPAPNGLPDGKVAVASTGDVRRAWYGRPSKRYDHGVLGDAIEAASLVAVDGAGRNFEITLDQSHVFEDLTPRIFDLDGDGRNEIITIRSSIERGAAIAIYGVVDGVLQERAATREIGRSHRWLNIAGIGDYAGASSAVIVWVETPHIGGTLRMGAFDGKNFQIFSESYRGFSNHFIGSRELGLSATGDFTGDGVPDLAVPSADRNSIVIVAGTGLATIPLPGRVGHAIIAIGTSIVTADTDGNLIVVRP